MKSTNTNSTQTTTTTTTHTNNTCRELPTGMYFIQAIEMNGDVYIIGSAGDNRMWRYDHTHNTPQWSTFETWSNNWFEARDLYAHTVMKYRDIHKDTRTHTWSLLACNACTNQMKYLRHIDMHTHTKHTWMDVTMHKDIQMGGLYGARMLTFGAKDREERDRHVIITYKYDVYVYDVVDHVFKAVLCGALPLCFIYHALFEMGGNASWSDVTCS